MILSYYFFFLICALLVIFLVLFLYAHECLMHHSQKQQFKECANMVYFDKLVLAHTSQTRQMENVSQKLVGQEVDVVVYDEL